MSEFKQFGTPRRTVLASLISGMAGTFGLAPNSHAANAEAMPRTQLQV
jgi:hypothetical protein